MLLRVDCERKQSHPKIRDSGTWTALADFNGEVFQIEDKHLSI